MLLTHLEWLWTAHSGNVGHVYSISYKQPFQNECSSNTPCWSLLQGIQGMPGELWRLQPPSSSSHLGREGSQFGSLVVPGVTSGWTELPLCLCRELLWGCSQFLPVFPPHTRFHPQLQQRVTSWLRAKHHPAADKLQLCHNKHEWLWQCWNVKFRRFSNLPEWICCQFSLCQWVFYVFSVFCTFSLEGGGRFFSDAQYLFSILSTWNRTWSFLYCQGADLWCSLMTLLLPEILLSVFVLLLLIIINVF